MAKRKRKERDFLNDFIVRSLRQEYFFHYDQNIPCENALQQAKADGLLHERERSVQKGLDMFHFALALQENQKELRKVKKFINEMNTYVCALDKRYHKMEKKVQEVSDKIDVIEKKRARQKACLKKYGSRIRQQKKAIRFMGACIGINNPADNLEKVLNKCSKKLDAGYSNNSSRIIDGEYREVTK